jgi:hypothetical protein
MKNAKQKTIDPHLIYIYKNTTPAQRLEWLKRAVGFAKKMKAKKSG